MLRIGTVFSGIGAFEYALKKLNLNYKAVFACDTGDRKLEISDDLVDDIKAIKDDKQRQEKVNSLYDSFKKTNRLKDTYLKNYKLDKSEWYTDIRFLDGKKYHNKIDVFVGGSPCQSFSLMGKRRGLEDTRGTLFYEFARLVKEIQPKVFIFENVPGMLVHDNGKTWRIIQNVFYTLGYDIHWKVLNSAEYGVPQCRKRLFVVGFKGKEARNFSFPETIDLNKTVFDYLEKDIDPKYYLTKKGFEFVTSPKHRGRARINSPITRTQKRNQQFNWNGDFIFEKIENIKNPAILKRAYVGEYLGEIGVVRKLTPRECHRLMGFPDEFKICENDVDAYKQSGNSIVVNVLEEIFKEIMKVENFDD